MPILPLDFFLVSAVKTKLETSFLDLFPSIFEISHQAGRLICQLVSYLPKQYRNANRMQILNLAIETIKVGRAMGYNVVPPMGDFSLDDMEEAAGPNGHPELDRVLSGEPPAVPGRPSMAQDVIKGRATEIEYLNGMVSDKGTEMGIKTPYSNAVVEVLKAVESGEFDIGVDNLDRVASIVKASA